MESCTYTFLFMDIVFPFWSFLQFCMYLAGQILKPVSPEYSATPTVVWFLETICPFSQNETHGAGNDHYGWRHWIQFKLLLSLHVNEWFPSTAKRIMGMLSWEGKNLLMILGTDEICVCNIQCIPVFKYASLWCTACLITITTSVSLTTNIIRTRNTCLLRKCS